MPSRLTVSKTTLLAALIACALYFSGFLVILTPLPLLYAAAMRGRGQGLLATALSAAAVAALYLLVFPAGFAKGALGYVPAPGAGLLGFMPVGFFEVFGVGYFAFFVAIAAALWIGSERRLSLTEWGGYALIAGVSVAFATIAVAAVVCDGSLLEGVNSYILHVLTGVVDANGSQPLESSQLMFLTDNTDRVASGVVEVLPALAFVYTVIAVTLNLVLGRRFTKSGRATARVPSAVKFRLPDWMIWTVIASGLAFFANSYAIDSPPLRTMALNGLICSGVLYFLQGMAVTVYFLQRIKFTLIRTVAYVAIIIFLQTVSVALVVLGIADVWADFRLRHLRMQHGR